MVKIIDKHNPPGSEISAAAGAMANAPADETGASLDGLRPGQDAVVSGISAAPALRMHLLELGFVAGSPVAFLMSTPFGDPGIYSLRGASIALRRSEARCILVKT